MLYGPGSVSTHRRQAAGFTLMEILLAIAIVAFIMMALYGTLYTTIEARDQIEKESLKSKIGPAILSLIERDISGVWSMNIHNNDVFFGEDHTVNGVPADTFHMITTTDSTIVEMSEDEAIRSDLSEVSYRLRSNPEQPEYLELYRRQDFHVDDRITEGGVYELIFSRVISFEVFYYKDLYEGADRYDKWDTKVRNRLPAAMEIYLTLEVDPRLAGYDRDDMERPVQEFHRVLFFPTGSELTMAIRPVVPTFTEPQDDELLGGGGGGGDGKGGGGGGDGKGGEGDGGPMGGGGHGFDLPDDGTGFKPGDDLPDLPDELPPGPNPDDLPDIEEWWKVIFGSGG